MLIKQKVFPVINNPNKIIKVNIKTLDNMFLLF